MKYQYGKVEIGVSVFMVNVTAAGTADNTRKGIHNCRRMEIEKKMIYGLKKLNIWSSTRERNQKKQ